MVFSIHIFSWTNCCQISSIIWAMEIVSNNTFNKGSCPVPVELNVLRKHFSFPWLEGRVKHWNVKSFVDVHFILLIVIISKVKSWFKWNTYCEISSTTMLISNAKMQRFLYLSLTKLMEFQLWCDWDINLPCFSQAIFVQWQLGI